MQEIIINDTNLSDRDIHKVGNKVRAVLIRDNNIICDIYYTETSFKKKLNYANKLKIPYICIIGEDEEKENLVTIKNMETGNQEKVKIENLIDKLKNS